MIEQDIEDRVWHQRGLDLKSQKDGLAGSLRRAVANDVARIVDDCMQDGIDDVVYEEVAEAISQQIGNTI
jgi:hypothetical protein